MAPLITKVYAIMRLAESISAIAGVGVLVASTVIVIMALRFRRKPTDQ